MSLIEKKKKKQWWKEVENEFLKLSYDTIWNMQVY